MLAFAALIAGVGIQGHNSRISDPDYSGRQHIWTLNRKSMDLYEGKVKGSPIGETNYELSKSLARLMQSHYDIKMHDQTKGSLRANFTVMGEEYEIKLDNGTTKLSRPGQFWRYRWKFERPDGSSLFFQETHRSAWNPLVHEFQILDVSGKEIGRLSGDFNLWRMITSRRDYNLKLDAAHKSALNREEVIAILTVLGNISKQAQD